MTKNDEKKSAGLIQDYANTLYSEISRALQDTGNAFRRAILLYTIAFWMGIVLIIASIWAAFYGGLEIQSGIIGGVGILSLFSVVLMRPIEKLQASRGKLFQAQATLATWFNNVYYWDRHISKIGTEEPDKLKFALDELNGITIKLIELMGKQLSEEAKLNQVDLSKLTDILDKATPVEAPPEADTGDDKS